MWRLGTPVVFAIALLARLLPVLRGGGLFGLGSYDDGVYFATTVGWLHGALPYRDVLFLQPPGMLVALTPFAALGMSTTEGVGFAAARIGWMIMGAISAVLVTRVALPMGRLPALLGGLFYALWWPAIYVERTTMLEGLSTFTLLVALLMLGRLDRAADERRPVPTRMQRGLSLGAGLLLGFGLTVKIWGVLTLLLVLAWQLAPGRIRRLGWLILGSAVAGAAVYLPFFLTAPAAMWRQVVTDQTTRTGLRIQHLRRMSVVFGLDQWQPEKPVTVALMLIALVAVVAALTVPAARLPVLLVAAFTVLMVQFTPNLFRQYPAVLAAPNALVLAGALAAAGPWVRRRVSGARARLGLRVAGVIAVLVALGLYALPQLDARLGTAFPRRAFAPAVAELPGCLTSDEPTLLIELDQVGRTVRRGCRLVVDYGGYAYDLPTTTGRRDRLHIRDTAAWQQGLRAYLATGSAALHVRNKGDGPAAEQSWAIWTSWPVIVARGEFVLRRPPGRR